ncbi:MAG TPA: PAS domain S-box protein [Ignavibacteria bacterium]|nr:PAS domain S-box protein [Ignavibacteria bacterium]
MVKRIPEKKYINIGFIAALLILISVNIVIYLNIRFHFEDEAIITKSLLVIQSSEALYSAIVEAETNRRGYLITSNEEFMKEYFPSLNAIDSSFSNLNSIVKDPEERKTLDTLKQLIFNRKDLLQESLELQEKRSKDYKAQIEFTSKGKIYLDRIKAGIESIQSIERQTLNARLLEAESGSAYTLTNLVVGNVIAFALLIFAVILLNRSINKRKAAEISLEENRNWLATTLESIGDAVIVTSKIGEILFINKAAEELTGWKSAEANGLLIDHVFNIYNEDTGNRSPDPIQKVVSNRRVIGLDDHTVLIRKDKSEIPIDDSAAPIINAEGELIGVVMVFRNISERRKSEKEILNNQKFIKRIADSLPSVLYIYDLKGPKISFTNYKIAELLGYDAEEVMKMGEQFFGKFIHPEDYKKLRSNFQKYYEAKDNDILIYEYRILDSKGKYRWFRSHEVVFSRNEEGGVTEILGSAFDITNRKLLEQELQKYSGHLEELVDKRTGELQAANRKLKQEIYERARAEGYIIDAEEKFRSLVENALVGIYILQEDNYAYVNPKYEEIFGYEKGEMIGMNAWDVVIPAHKELVIENIRKRVVNEVNTIQYSFKAVKKDGTIIDVEVKGSTMMYSGNLAIIGTLQDITDRLRYEQELRNSRQKLLLHVERTPLGVIEWDMNFSIVQWNHSAERIFGWKNNEVTGKNAEIIIPDEIKPHVSAIWNELVSKKGGERSTNENITKDGRRVLCEWYNTPLINENDEVIGVASLVEDVTERIKAEEQLRAQREYLRTVIDTDPNFVFAKDWDGKFTLVNKAVADNYGTTVDNLIGRSDADFNPNIQEVEHFLNDDREVITTGNPKFIPEEQVTDSRTGRAKWFQTIKVPLRSSEGSMHVLGVAADITARKLAEEITWKSLKEKELLLKEIHHRVKNNLQIIVSLLKLQSKYVFDPRDLEIFNKSRSRVETMSLIHEKLYKSADISQIDMGNYLRDLVGHLLKAYNLSTARIEFDIDAENILMSIDTAIPCGLIVNELINNILKHAFPDGYNGKIQLNLHRSDENVILEVVDNGVGIPESFNMDKNDSLGMQLIDTLVKQLDGVIEVTRTNGTRFSIEFRELKYKERI